MKLLPAGLGAEPKKLAFLVVLLGVLIVVYFVNRTPSAPTSEANSVPSTARPAAVQPFPAATRLDVATPMPAQRSQRAAVENSIQDFKPSLKPPDGTDVSRIDPTLRLDEIAKLRTLDLEGGSRSIFDFGAAAPPKALPSVLPIKPALTVPKPVAPVVSALPAPGPPPVPPIPLKFYGYVDPSSATRQAFFLQGDDIFVAGENDVVGNRYKIVRINPNSAVVEDTITKNQQTLPLIEELPG
jgi:hypothetical protein